MTTEQSPTDQERNARSEILRWRKAERERLIAERLAMSADLRADHGAEIAALLDETIGAVSGLIVSAYWPFRGEPDLRDWLGSVVARGGRAALPIVVEKGAPLIFRTWKQGDRLERGVWNIPVPADGEEVAPDIVIAPVVGFDPSCYRLGYGGGFFDRTLAAATNKPRAIGVGYAQAAMPTIRPQWHDIPMTRVITEEGVLTPRAA